MHSRWCPTVLYMACAALVVMAVIYFLYIGYMETRINTPISAPKVCLYRLCIIYLYYIIFKLYDYELKLITDCMMIL